MLIVVHYRLYHAVCDLPLTPYSSYRAGEINERYLLHFLCCPRYLNAMLIPWSQPTRRWLEIGTGLIRR